MFTMLTPRTPAGATSHGRLARDAGEHQSKQASAHVKAGEELPRLSALARIVAEAEQAAPERGHSRAPALSVAQRMQRLYAFD